jgi:hypothetical protein
MTRLKHSVTACLLLLTASALAAGQVLPQQPSGQNPSPMVDHTRPHPRIKQSWASITLSAFSAGYGAVREILRRPEYFALVNNVLLLDGIHTSYVPEGTPAADGGALDSAALDVFVKFAREAVAGRKGVVFTHSEIFPGTYASTTECADYLLEQLSLEPIR